MILLDGGMGQELVKRSGDDPTPLWATKVMLDHPHIVRAIHDDYFNAGAQIATANTYAIHHDRLIHHGLDDQFAALHQAACQIAVEARNAHGSGQVAGSLGPMGWSYQPETTPPVDEAAEAYAEIVALHKPHVDLHLIETASSVNAARGALQGCAQTDKPVWLAVSVDDDDGTKLRSGEPLAEVTKLSGFAALLLNCSRPEAVSQGLALLGGTDLTFGAYGNGFTKIVDSFKSNTATVKSLSVRTDLGPEAYLAHACDWAALGASIIGGCCEVGPDHIRALHYHFEGVPA